MQYSLILYATTTTRFSKLNQREEGGGGLCRCGDERVPWAAAGGVWPLVIPAAARWRLEQVAWQAGSEPQRDTTKAWNVGCLAV